MTTTRHYWKQLWVVFGENGVQKKDFGGHWRLQEGWRLSFDPDSANAMTFNNA